MTYYDWRNARCRRCGWSQGDPYETVSRHLTSTGLVVYTRCACGLLQVRHYPQTEAGPRILAQAGRSVRASSLAECTVG